MGSVLWLIIHVSDCVLDIALCELTASVRITSKSVVTANEDGNDGVLDGGIDSEGRPAPLAAVWVTGGLGGCIWLTSKSFDVNKSK